MKLTKGEKKWFGWMLYILYLLVVCEIALRVYLVYFADSYRFEIYASRSMLENRFGETTRIPHSYLGVANNPGYAYGVNQHNSHGFRGEEILEQKPDSIVRIVCIGGSTTYGTGVEDYRQSYPHLLNEALAQKGIHAEVINAGSAGYNSLQSYINYHINIEELKPDLLIIYHAINDLTARMVWPPEAYAADYSGSFAPIEYGNVSIFNYLRKLSVIRVPLVYTGFIDPDIALSTVIQIQETNYFLSIREQLLNDIYPSGIFESVPVDSMIKTNRPVFFEKNLEKLIRQAKSNDTQVVLSTFIYSDMFPDHVPELSLEGYQNGIKEHNDILRNLSGKYDLPLLDLEKEMTVEREWFTDGIHFNLLGNQKRVEEITKFLIPIIQVSETDSTGPLKTELPGQ